VRGLSYPVEIARDRWGVSHIYARTEGDLFFAQGYSAARDRLFQFELWRRQATGTTAEILGPRALSRDIGTRLQLFRGDLTRELNWYHPRGAAIVNAFVRGVNAYIAETERDPALLPLEFRLLGITPGHWTPAVVISRHQGLLGNVDQEVAIGRAVATIGAAAVRAIVPFGPGEPRLTLEEPVDGPALLEDDVLALYNAYRTPLTFRREDIVAQYRADSIGSGTALGRLDASAAEAARWPVIDRSPADIGSNNWVVNGARTQAGAPLLANDPHRAIQVPSLRYMVHLVAPGWNVIGGGEPVLPGVSIGHNEYGGWGLTVFTLDGEDLYVYATDPADPRRYRYRGAWEVMRIIRDTIRVKGGSPVVVDLTYTRHGPVLYEDTAHHRAYALRAAWREVGSAPYLASLRIDQARTWEQFRDACSYSRIPGENMVWADRAGHIGYQAVGIAPIRPNWSGLVPVPGDGRYEWAGYLPIKELPHAYDPPQGFWVTANNDLVPRGYRYRNAVGWTWADPYRAERIEEVVGSGRRFSVADMARLQQDELSIPARTLVPMLLGLTSRDSTVRQAVEVLRRWDYVLGARSVAAGIYVAWERRLQAAVADAVVPARARPYLRFLSLAQTIDWLTAPDGRFGSNPTAGRDTMLMRSFEQGVGDLAQRFGSDTNRWRYGQPGYKHVLIQHPMSSAVADSVRARLDVGPLARGGSAHTVNATGGSDNQTAGPSFRVILDTSDWDNSIATNTPGQVGDPGSAHYEDLFTMWARGGYFPLFYSRAKVNSVVEAVTVLAPALGPAAPRPGSR
jgi:penicillin amidase